MPVDRNAAPLHARQHRHERTLQGLVDAGHVLGDHPGAQHIREAQRHIGVLCDVGRSLLELHAIECDLGFAGADHVVIVHRHVIEVARRERIERVTEAPGIEHVGHQHRVLERPRVDAAHSEKLQLELHVLADLQDTRVLEQRLERSEHFVL